MIDTPLFKSALLSAALIAWCGVVMSCSDDETKTQTPNATTPDSADMPASMRDMRVVEPTDAGSDMKVPTPDMDGGGPDMGPKMSADWRYVHDNRGYPNDIIWRDFDEDGSYDRLDNCPYDANPAQEDRDGDGIGDICDNCQDTPNAAQGDDEATELGIGNVCSPVPKGDICDEQETLFNLAVPNIYFALDSSGSMKGEPLTQAIDGLSTIADRLSGQIRAGFGAFPIGNTCGSALRTFLPVGQHASRKIKASYQTVYATGATPTASVFRSIREQDLVSSPCNAADPSLTPNCDRQDARRIKVVVLITDGYPTVCGTVSQAEREVSMLAASGVRTFVVGYNLAAGSPVLNRLARAGNTDASQGAPGGDRYFLASNSEDLVDVIERIRDDIVGCTYDLAMDAPAPEKIWVKVDDTFAPRDAYTYTATPTPQVELEPEFCAQIRGQDELPDKLRIISGCPESCDPQAFWGCCKDKAEACTADTDCCAGTCEEGVCVEACRTFGVPCESNEECCEGSCAINSGEAEGICLSG